MDRESKSIIAEIAKMTGLSPATVSRALNYAPNVSDENRQRCLKAYTVIFRAKPPGFVVGLVVPDASNPFFSGLTDKLATAFALANTRLISANTAGNLQREIEVVQDFKRYGVKGLILITAGGGDEDLLPLLADGVPALVLDRKLEHAAVDFVAVDSRSAIVKAVDYLCSYGHRDIAFLGGVPGTHTARDRREAFVQAMQGRNLSTSEDRLFDGDYSLAAGHDCAEQLLAAPVDGRPTAVIAANDLMAVAVMQRVQAAGWRIPNDLSVIGFDDMQWSAWTHPGLTTLAQPTDDMVSATTRLLLRRIRAVMGGKKSIHALKPESVILDCALVERCSVGRPHREFRDIGE